MKKQSTDIHAILGRLSLEQKAQMCSGKDFWNLVGYEDLGIPSIMLTDGPHGLRKQEGKGDHAGLSESVPAVCFPSAAAIASSWDEELIEEMGSLLADECRQEKVAILLGPGANIKRSPLCGRNFEYFSEDPVLSGKLAAAHIRGVQKRGIGASLKHFAANNQEHRRMTIDTIVDNRALREIYLTGFEIAVKEGKPDTVMNAYNRLNGVYCSEHKTLLTDILRKEWGHRGFVVTDWGAENDRVEGLIAGQELEMPGPSEHNTSLIIDAVRSGSLAEEVLDEAVRRILAVVLRTYKTLSEPFRYDEEDHHQAARRILTESAILLKNDSLLPLEAGGSLAVIGEFAKIPRYQGSGSSLIRPTRIDSAWDAMLEFCKNITELSYAPGYRAHDEAAHPQLIQEAVSVAARCETAVIFAGLPDISESEGFDRKHLDLPDGHRRLIEEVAKVNLNCIVVLSNGSPVTMPWIENVGAVLETYLGGQAWGSAVVDLLFGRVNPSGKLAESFPLRLEDVPSTVNFPGGTNSVVYAESVYVGYRYYDKAGTPLLFPFGHGLSYTVFEYSDLSITGPDDGGAVQAKFTVCNSGSVSGKEIVQLYIRDIESSVFMPDKQLKAFSKISLEPGECRELILQLTRRDFSFWDAGAEKWAVEAGDFEILIGSSSRDIRLQAVLNIKNGDELSPWARTVKERAPGYYEPSTKVFADLSDQGPFAGLYGKGLPPRDIPRGTPFSRFSTLEDVSKTLVGGILYWGAKRQISKMAGKNADEKTREMMAAMVREMPIKSIAMLGGMSSSLVDGLISMMNRRFLKGFLQIIARKKKKPY